VLVVLPTWVAFIGYTFVVYKIGPQDFGLTIEGVLVDARWVAKIPTTHHYYGEETVRHPKHFDYYKQLTLNDRSFVSRPPTQSTLLFWYRDLDLNRIGAVSNPYIYKENLYYFKYLNNSDSVLISHDV
jgi:hypothetical protein